MSEPNQVPEQPGWIFIRGSEHPIAAAVERYELGRLRLARYVGKDSDEFPDGQLGVMRLLMGESVDPEANTNERWKMWAVVVRCRDENGVPMTREPNAYILRQLEAFDTWARGRDRKHIQRWAERERERRKKRADEAFRTSMDDRIGKLAREVRRELGYNGRIYVLDNPIAKDAA